MRRSIIPLIIILLISCSENQEKQYYENGNIKLKAEIQDGKRDGFVYEYYEDGTIKSKGEWHNGLVHGTVEHYYPNGKLKSSSKWVKGQQSGGSKEYYESGELWSTSTLKNDVMVGETKFYNREGTVIEKHRYNDNGGLIEMIKFNEAGIRKTGGRYPTYSVNERDLKHGEYSLIFKFEEPVYEENKVHYETEIIIGELTEGGSDVIDTITILTGDANVLQYTFKPTKVGENYVSGIINDNYRIGDETFTNTFPFKIPFYVERDSIPSVDAP